MKIAGFLQTYDEERKGNIRRCLDSMSRYCDVICIYDDASEDNTVDVALSYNKVRLIRGKTNEFDKELYHKAELLNFTLSFNPDWIFWMDCDEVIEKRGEDGGLRELAEMSNTDACDFREVNLWRSDRYYRIDNQFNDGIFCRLWRNTGRLKYNPKSGLHHKLFPEGIQSIKTSSLRIIHYGFSSSSSILDKYRTYKSHGQTGWALDRILSERGIRLREVDKTMFREPPSGPTFQEIKNEGLLVDLL